MWVEKLKQLKKNPAAQVHTKRVCNISQAPLIDNRLVDIFPRPSDGGQPGGWRRGGGRRRCKDGPVYQQRPLRQVEPLRMHVLRPTTPEPVTFPLGRLEIARGSRVVAVRLGLGPGLAGPAVRAIFVRCLCGDYGAMPVRCL